MTKTQQAAMGIVAIVAVILLVLGTFVAAQQPADGDGGDAAQDGDDAGGITVAQQPTGEEGGDTIENVIEAAQVEPAVGPHLSTSQRRRVEALLADPSIKDAAVSFKVRHLGTGATLFEHESRTLCMPASTNKLVTGAAAYAILGPEYQFKTRVVADAAPDVEGVIHGNLYIVGGGDPSLTMEQVWKLAHGVRIAGVKRVTGDLVGDESCHDSLHFYPEWGRQTYRAYQAPVGGLSVNFNTLAFWVRPGPQPGAPAFVTIDPSLAGVKTVGQIETVAGNGNKSFMSYGDNTIYLKGQIGQNSRPDATYTAIGEPLPFALAAVRDMLTREGVQIGGQSRAGKAPARARTIHEHLSDELCQIVRFLYRFSNNFTAEQILRTIGAVTTGGQGTRENGAAAVVDWLRSQNLYQDGVVMFDGSGLARENRESAASLVDVLTWVGKEPRLFAEYLNAQPIGGVNGTLRRRFRRSPLNGRVRAKTGYINGVVALAGYVYDARGELYAFGALINGFNPAAGVRGPQLVTEQMLEVMME